MADWNWTTNPIMEWKDPRTGLWVKISDHGRTPLNVSINRIGTDKRMANGRMRRYVVAKKRSFSTSWDNLPDKNHDFLANGQAGEWMEKFHNAIDGSFEMRLRAGSDGTVANADVTTLTRDTTGDTDLADNEREFVVMITDFSKEVIRRGREFDLWSLDITLEEV